MTASLFCGELNHALLKYIIPLFLSLRTRARGNVARAHARVWGYSFNIYLSIIYALRG